jgi:GGDEF domain-containing protein
MARAARAAQQLCDVLWEAMREELLLSPDTARAAELSERLADISSTIAMLAAAAPPSRLSQGGSATLDLSPPDPTPASSTPASAVPASPASMAVPSTPTPPVRDRRTPPEPSPVARQPIASGTDAHPFTKLVDEQEAGTHAEPLATVQPIQPEIEIRDVRREEGPSAWVSSVGRLLARHAQDGLPFAVLLVEIVDVAQLERSETPHDLHGLVAKVEDALGRGMRTTDHLSRETLGRYWLVAPETNGTGARMLAERLARLVRTSASHRGVPMEVAIGIAVCPDDGTEAPALAARADLGVYSARATGRSIAHTDPPRPS